MSMAGELSTTVAEILMGVARGVRGEGDERRGVLDGRGRGREREDRESAGLPEGIDHRVIAEVSLPRTARVRQRPRGRSRSRRRRPRDAPWR